MAISASRDFVVFPNDNAGRINVNESVFTANGTWTAPANITSAQVLLVGGGGGGGGGSQNVAGGGGAGGQVMVKNITVVPGTTYSINIGAGGQGGQGALLSAADVTSTLPGSNGGNTTFGTLTIGNLLPSAMFDFEPTQWDGNFIFRQISGISGQNVLTVYPNTNGIEVGMAILGTAGSAITGMPASPSNIVVAKTANTVTIGNMAPGGALGALSANIGSGGVGVLATFDYDDTRVFPSTVVWQNISAGALTNNVQTLNLGSSPYSQNLSNNLLPPQLAQFEETNVAGTGAVAGTLVRTYGTSAPTPITTLLTSPASPKLPEMIAPFTKFITATSGSGTVIVDSTTNILPGMFLTLPSGVTGVTTGTVVLSVDSATQITVQAPSGATSGTYTTAITANLTSQRAFFSYTGSTGAYAIKFTTPATANTSNIWVSLSSLNNTTNTTGTTTSAGTAGVAWQPGAQYIFSFYISSDVDIATSEMTVQLRSANNTTMATQNVQYTGGSAGLGSSIDTGTANGFFVRETSINTMPGVGGDVVSGQLFVASSVSSGATSFDIVETPSANPQYDLTATVIKGMVIAGTGISSATIQSVSYSTGVYNGFTMQKATVVVNSGIVTANLTGLTSTFTLTRPSGVAVIGTNTGTNANGWRRVYGTFTSLPGMQTYSTAGGTAINQLATAANLYAYGAQPIFVHPVIVFKKASATVWIDNAQLELVTAANGGVPTPWMPPLMQGDSSSLVKVGTATLGNMETSHRYVKAVAGTVYSGSAYVMASGTGNTYRPYYAWVEFFDADYNSLGRTSGSFVFAPLTGLASTSQTVAGTNYTPTYPVRVGVQNVTAPATTAWVKFGVAQLQGSQTSSEFALFYPQLEVGATITSVKRPVDGVYTWAGAPGASALVSYTGTYAVAEGGGGGGTWNSNNPFWLYGLQGGNNGGHAANGSNTYTTLAGGGGGAGSIGSNGIQYTGALSNTTTSAYQGTLSLTAGMTQSTYPLRGNLGGYALVNSATTANAGNNPGYAGDGGLGVWPFNLNSNHLGIALGGGGGGAGWILAGAATTGPNSGMVPGRGQGGGGKGGGTNLVQALSGNVTGSVTDYYARGIDGQPNTGGGGGGGGTNMSNAPLTTFTHYLAGRTVNSENAGGDATKWSALYNAIVQTNTTVPIYGSTNTRVTIQDVGNARIQTTAPSFAILPRTPLVLTGIAARLTGPATTTVTSTQFVGLSKRVRPVIRWKTWNQTLIKEERPPYEIIFAATNTITYLGPNTATNAAGTWETAPAPANAYYFDVVWEFLYFDGSDIVDVDMSDLQYFPYLATGGNGADGLAIVRWFDKTTA